MQSELADTEARLERALAESAGADEMVGQMLARVGEVEAKLHEAESAHADAEGRLASACAEADAHRDEAAALLARLTREKEERETLGLRVGELAKVCEERDGALLREELLEAELGAVRAETIELRAAHSAELAAALAREEAASSRVVGAAELAAVSAERDALATEARHLRDAVERVGRVLSELTLSLGGERHVTAPPIAESQRPPSQPGHDLVNLVDDASEEEATKVFGAREMALVRESARKSEPGAVPAAPAGRTKR